MLSTLRALHGNLYALTYARGLGGSNRRQSLVLGLLAWLAALWLIPQTLILKKELLAGCPDETLSTVYAVERAIFKLCL